MSKNKADNPPTGKTFSADAVAALLASLSVSSIPMKNYELMSALDGNKTASAFQHDFRSVLQKAKDLRARIDGGEEFVPVKAGTKRSAKVLTTPPTTPARPKITPRAPIKPRAKRPKTDRDHHQMLQPEKMEVDGPAGATGADADALFGDATELQANFVDALNNVKKERRDEDVDVPDGEMV